MDTPIPETAKNNDEQGRKMLMDIGFEIEEYTYRPAIEEITALRNLSEEEKMSVYNDSLTCRQLSYLIMKCKNV